MQKNVYKENKENILRADQDDDTKYYYVQDLHKAFSILQRINLILHYP